jgi:DNA-binding NarL/FixJ family response regulator
MGRSADPDPALAEFSRALLRIHAAPDLDALAQVRGELRATGLAAELLERHFLLRREQLRVRQVLPLERLTAREQQVLGRVSLGETDRMIGRMLGITPRTASKHVENILRKLGVETRTAAAALARPPAPGR